MDRFECDYTLKIFDKLWRVWQFKWESTHQFWSTSYMQLVVMQTADICTYCMHTCAKAFAICSNQYEITIWREQEANCSEIWTYCYCSFENWAKAIEKNCNNRHAILKYMTIFHNYLNNMIIYWNILGWIYKWITYSMSRNLHKHT